MKCDIKKKSKVRVFKNTISNREVFIIIFINTDVSYNSAVEYLRTFSKKEFSVMPIGRNAFIFIQRLEEGTKRRFVSQEEHQIAQLMMMTLSNKKGKLRKAHREIVEECKAKPATRIDIKI